MTSSDHNNDLVTSQKEKLEWVTPKILLMEAEDKEGKRYNKGEFTTNKYGYPLRDGPS